MFDLRPFNALKLRGGSAGRDVIVQIEGSQDWRHALGSLAGSRLAVSGSISVSVLSEDGELLTRHHSDVAEVGQPGAAGHLQVGGKPSMVERPENEWLDVPRWPMPPMDILLIVELAVYSFLPNYWEEIRGQAVWLERVQRSESLAYSFWRKQFDGYWNQRNSRATWLTEQCNLVNPWPRASSQG